MTFTMTRAGSCERRACVYATGPIELSTVREFRIFVEQEGVREGTPVILNSGGGNQYIGISLGVEFRRLALDTQVGAVDGRSRRLAPGVCASACVYAFIGGVRREVATGSRLGVHQVAIPDVISTRASVSGALWLMGQAAIHLQRMGATPDVVALALTTQPEMVRWLTPAELRRFAVVTDNSQEGRVS